MLASRAGNRRCFWTKPEGWITCPSVDGSLGPEITIMTTSFRIGAVCFTSLALAVGCHRNFEWSDEAESALGRPTGHDSGGAAMIPYKGQRTCPVTGEKLGSAGAPIPLKLKGDMIYVCCSSCVEKAKADADACLVKVKAERAKVIAQKPPLPDLGPYDGQTHCPVSGDELEPDGSSRDLVVKGERIWVCCNDCASHARANFARYFPKVKAERDAALAAAMAKAPMPTEGTAPASPKADPNARMGELVNTSEGHGPAQGDKAAPPPDTGSTPQRVTGGIQ